MYLDSFGRTDGGFWENGFAQNKKLKGTFFLISSTILGNVSTNLPRLMGRKSEMSALIKLNLSRSCFMYL